VALQQIWSGISGKHAENSGVALAEEALQGAKDIIAEIDK